MLCRSLWLRIDGGDVGSVCVCRGAMRCVAPPESAHIIKIYAHAVLRHLSHNDNDDYDDGAVAFLCWRTKQIGPANVVSRHDIVLCGFAATE